METEINKRPHRTRRILYLGLLLALVLLSALVYKLSGASTAEYESLIEEYTDKVIAKHGRSFVLHQPSAQREKLKTRGIWICALRIGAPCLMFGPRFFRADMWEKFGASANPRTLT